MSEMPLILGRSKRPRITNALALLSSFINKAENEQGIRYYDYPSSESDQVVVADLGVTLLLNSRVGSKAAVTLCDRACEIDLSLIPRDRSLADADDALIHIVAGLIAQVASWPNFGASVATKLLHKKRPRLVPVLDNMAIFGAYLDPDWPVKPPRVATVKNRDRIHDALFSIHGDLVRSENKGTWQRLHDTELGRNRPTIELFDMIWWMHFRYPTIRR